MKPLMPKRCFISKVRTCESDCMMYQSSDPTCIAVRLCQSLITVVKLSGQAYAGANFAPPGVRDGGH